MNREPSKTSQPPLLLTVKQTAAILQIGINRTYRMCRQGELPAIVIGNSFRVPRGSLEAWISAQLERKESEHA